MNRALVLTRSLLVGGLLGTTWMLPACALRHPPVEREPGPASWFMDQRAVGGGVPVRARGRALEAWRARSPQGTPGAWRTIGPYNVGGRVTALAVDPNDPARIWVGAAEGGVFVPADPEGTYNQWRPVFDDQTALSIGSLATHPTDSNIVYVGTGEDNGGGFSYDGEGVFKTTDGGATWTNMGLAEVRRIGRIAVDPVSPQRVFVAAGGNWYQRDLNRGIYRSVDGGQNWERVLNVSDDTGGIDVVIDPSNPNRVFAALWQRQTSGHTWYVNGSNSGIYRSQDGGTSWTRLTAGLPASSGRIGLAVAPSNPQVVYASINDAGISSGLYRSTNSGDTWTKMSNSADNGRGYYFSKIRTDPNDANKVYWLSLFIYRTTNGGSSFQTIGDIEVHPDIHALLIGPGTRLVAGTDGGIYQSEDSGSTWQFISGLPITQIYDLGVDVSQPGRLFAGFQDNWVWRTATGGPFSWTGVLTGADGLQCEVDPTDPSKVYAEFQNGAMFRSIDGGDTWENATSGFSGRKNWNVPITLDPFVPTTLYTGSIQVYRSTNSAASWSAISPDLTFHPHESHTQSLVRDTITVVSVSPADNRILWAGTDNGNVWVSADAGTSWTQVNPEGDDNWVTDIEPDRFDASKAYLTVTGYRTGASQPYVRVTRDLGATWEDLSAGLPEVPVNTILPSSEWRGRLFVGNDLGVFWSDDDGASWSDVRNGMPHVVVLDLEEDTAEGKLYAGTHGRSAYTYELDQLGAADGNADGVDNNADCALGNPTAFAVPPEVFPLEVARGAGEDSVLSWPSLAPQAGSGTVYDVATGLLADLATGGTSSSVALACGVGATPLTDGTSSATGQGAYYFIRARNACGAGSWGRTSAGGERPSSACP